MWIKRKIEIGKLEHIGSKIGVFLATDSVASNMQDELRKSRSLDWQELMAWNAKIALDNEIYHTFVKRFSGGDLNATLADIETETKSLRQVLQKLDAGISTVDTSLLANARWIRSRTHYEPFILTDDGDLLASGHVLASFFGISLGCLSSFEAIRLTDLDEHLEECCKHFNLEGNYESLSHTWTQPDLEKCVSEVLRKGKLSCHINKVTSRLMRRKTM